jgi:ADP-dependent NAD(P)H-hydrate dehydratase / NAD(P)H-hydrate epimerase
MIPLFSPEKVRGIDDYAINQLGIPGLLLMENASINITNEIIKRYPLPKYHKIGIVCGKGNNGGDGFAVARQLMIHNYAVSIFHLFQKKDLSPDARANFEVLENITKSEKGLKIFYCPTLKEIKKIESSDVIVDAILGSGSQGNLSPSLSKLVEYLNDIKVRRVAVDISTGLNSQTGYGETVFNADLTITLGGLKPGLFFSEGYRYSGEVVGAGIGISDSYIDSLDTDTYLIEPEDALAALPLKTKTQNKYSAGKVLSIAGSYEYPGAGLLASLTPFYIGAGSSVLAFPQSLYAVAHTEGEYQLIVKKYDDKVSGFLSEPNITELQKRISWADALIIGPGLGINPETISAVRQCIKKFPEVMKVIDADALNALAGTDLKKFDLTNAVLTPHVGEFSRLTGIPVEGIRNDMTAVLREFCKKHQCHVVLKDFRTLIGNPQGEVFINTTGNEGLAKFGSGDVLSGVIGGLLAQTHDFEKASVAGVYLHGLTADILRAGKTEYGFAAMQLMHEIPSTIKFLRDSIV